MDWDKLPRHEVFPAEDEAAPRPALFPPTDLARILGGEKNGFTPESFPEEYYQPFQVNPTGRQVQALLPSLMKRSGPTDRFPMELPIRQQRLDFMLSMLDKHQEGIQTQRLDSNHMFGRGSTNAPTLDDPEPADFKESVAAFNAHIKYREPYFSLASRRLHNATGQSSDLPFDLPYHVRPPPLNSGEASKRDAEGVPKAPDTVGFNNENIDPKDFVDGVDVDANTGEGLREWLFAMGKMNGSQKKQEGYSVAFHDLRPHPRTGEFQNLLIAQFGIHNGGTGARIEVFETELPATFVNKDTGIEESGKEKWLWFLITRDLVTINPEDTSAIPEDAFVQQPYGRQSSPPPHPNSDLPLQPPPQFPWPVPVSWVVFAVPEANIKTHPQQEEFFKREGSPQLLLTHPDAPYLGRWHNYRKDYDYCFGGLPIFEFSRHKSQFFPANPGAYNLENIPNPQFLGVEMGPWHPDEDYGERDYQDLRDVKFRDLNEYDPRSADEKAEFWKRGRDVELEHPSRYHGLWWDVFTDKVYEDAGKWSRVRGAMTAGKCRIVLRWSEWKEDEAAVAAWKAEMNAGGDCAEGSSGGYGEVCPIDAGMNDSHKGKKRCG